MPSPPASSVVLLPWWRKGPPAGGALQGTVDALRGTVFVAAVLKLKTQTKIKTMLLPTTTIQ